MSRWEALYTGKGVGERVRNERYSTMNDYGWEGVRKEGGENIHKIGKEKGGAEGLD